VGDAMAIYYVYMLANRSRTLYTGATNNPAARLTQHRSGKSRFTNMYRDHRLVYVESTDDIHAVVAREKQIKGWIRAKKLALIESVNQSWDDLAEPWLGKVDSSLTMTASGQGGSE
jgi:putative endonuclease